MTGSAAGGRVSWLWERAQEHQILYSTWSNWAGKSFNAYVKTEKTPRLLVEARKVSGAAKALSGPKVKDGSLLADYLLP